MSAAFDFLLNGQPVRVEGVSPNTTLLEFLRERGLTGSKRGCDEGDCGACTVALLDRDAAGRPTYRAINSCIALVPMFAGREIVTVDGLAGAGGALHPVQARMVDHYGSQCGYCTPGFVVSLFEAYHRKDCREPWQLNDQLCGNLCRCTGYRPIRDAALAALAHRDGGTAADDPSSRGCRRRWPRRRSSTMRRGGAVFPPGLAGRALRPPARPPRGAPGRRRDRDRGRAQQEVPGLPGADFHRGGPGIDPDHRDPRRLASRGGGHPDRHRGGAGAGISFACEDAPGLRLAADPQPGHPGGQPRHGLPDRGQRPGPDDPGRRPRPRLAGGGADGAARRFFHGLSEDGPSARTRSSARSCCPAGLRPA